VLLRSGAMVAIPFFPALEDPSRNLVREAWDRLAKLPGGKWAFSKAIGRIAPYSGTVGAVVDELRPGFASVVLEDRPAVRNHLNCVHAIALVNLAEIAGNVALSYALSSEARFIVAGLSIDYVKKARGTIRAVGTCPESLPSDRREYLVPVVMTNVEGEVVARAELRTLVGPKASK
jgi:acyl-coenzyme A thioesterase PaaI-like protein